MPLPLDTTLICQLNHVVRALTATKCEQSLNACDIAAPRYICRFMQTVCNHVRHGRPVKLRFVRVLRNLKLQNSALICVSPLPFLTLPSVTTRFLHKYVFDYPLCCGIWQWTARTWCYSVARNAHLRVQLCNTFREWFIVEYHKNICFHLYHPSQYCESRPRASLMIINL